jgi:hypothetical protein
MVAQGHWPHACAAELRAHLDQCRGCADLLLVTYAFQNSRTAALGQAKLPAASALWWRAQLRRRNAAVERVGRPMLGAQIFAFCLTLLVPVGFVASQASRGLHWLNWFAQSQPEPIHLSVALPTSPAASGWSLGVLIPIFATVALVSAVAVYLASEKQ